MVTNSVMQFLRHHQKSWQGKACLPLERQRAVGGGTVAVEGGGGSIYPGPRVLKG